jgi:hypothetical protein
LLLYFDHEHNELTLTNPDSIAAAAFCKIDAEVTKVATFYAEQCIAFVERTIELSEKVQLFSSEFMMHNINCHVMNTFFDLFHALLVEQGAMLERFKKEAEASLKLSSRGKYNFTETGELKDISELRSTLDMMSDKELMGQYGMQSIGESFCPFHPIIDMRSS